MSSDFFGFNNDYNEHWDLQEQFDELERKRKEELIAKTTAPGYQPKELGSEGDWLDFLGRGLSNTVQGFADTGYGMGVPKKGYDLLSGLFTGQTKLDETQSDAVAPTIASNIGPALFAPPEEADTDISRATKAIFGGLGRNETFQRVGSKAIQAGLDMALDPSMPLLAPEAVGTKAAGYAGAVMLPDMISALGEAGGKGLSNYEQGKGAFGKENQEILGESLPMAAMLAHSLPNQAREVAHAIPEFKLGESGYTSRSPFTFKDPGSMGELGRGLPNFVSAMSPEGGGPKLSSERNSQAQAPDSFLTSIIGDDPLLKRMEELKSLGVLTPKGPAPKVIDAYHGTGNRDWAEGNQPFSSRMVADDNLVGGGQYNSSRSAESEGAYAIEGSKPGLLETRITTAKPFDFEGPVPRDFKVRGLTEINRAIKNAENPAQAKTYQELYNKFKNAKSGREAHMLLTDVLDRKRSTDLPDAEYPTKSGKTIKNRLPFHQREGVYDVKDLTNQILEQDLGYDAITHKGFGHDHDVTVPFSRHQIETKSVTPLEKLGNRSAESLVRDLELLSDHPADHFLKESIVSELNLRKSKLNYLGNDTSKTSILNDPELGPKYIADLETQIANLKSKQKALPKKTEGLNWDEQAKLGKEAQSLKTKLFELELVLENSKNYLKHAPDADLINETLSKTTSNEDGYDISIPRDESLGKLTPEEIDLLNQNEIDLGIKQGLIPEGTKAKLREAEKTLPVSESGSPKPINIPTIVDNVARASGWRPDPFENLASKAQGSSSSPATKFAESQARKYGKDWQEKQSPEEKAFYEKLTKSPDQAKFEKVLPTASSDKFNDQILEPEPSKLERTINRKDGSKMVIKEVEGLVQIEHYSKDGELTKATRGTGLDDQKPVEVLDSTKPFEYSSDPDIKNIQEGILAAPVSEAVPSESLPVQPVKEKSLPVKSAKPEKSSYHVFLDDGTRHTIKAENPESAQQLAENILSRNKSDKKVVDVKQKLSSLETAAQVPASPREIKLSEAMTKAQTPEELAGRRDETRARTKEEKLREKAEIQELRDQLKVENQKARAGNREARLRERAIEAELKDKLKVEAQFQREEMKRKKAEFQAKLNKKSSWHDSPVVRIFNAAKSIAYGGDVGHLLRQGKQMNVDLLFSKDAKKVVEQFPVLFKAAKSEKFFKDFHENLYADPDIKLATDTFGLDMPGVGKGHLKEEVFHGADIVENAPIIGQFYAKPSERIYTTGLNFLRAAEIKKNFASLRKKGLTPEANPEAFKGITRAINIISQRGEFSSRNAKILSDASFLFGAPRAKAARVQNLFELARGGESGAMVRRTAAKMIIFNLGLMGLLKAARPNGEIVTDKKRTDFGKFRDGDITVDLWAGMGVTGRTAIQAVTGEATSPHTKRDYNIAPIDPIVKEVSNMTSPGVRAAWILATGADMGSKLIGKPPGGYLVDRSEALSNILPMSPKQIQEILQSAGGVEKIIYAALQVGGEGVNVFNYKDAKAEQERLKKARGIKPAKKKSSEGGVDYQKLYSF